MELFVQHERYGPPIDGGYWDQSSFHMYVYECVKAARDSVESYERQKEAYEGFIESERQKEKANSPGVE